jgi:hypothetical protein
MTSHVAWKGLPPRNRKAWSRWRWRVCVLYSKERARPKPSCEPLGSYVIQAPRLSMISMPRLPPHACQCATRAPSTSGPRRDLPPGHKRDQRFDEGGPTNRELDGRSRPRRSRGYLHDRKRSGRACPVPTPHPCRGEALPRPSRRVPRAAREEMTRSWCWLANSEASPWMRTTCGWPRQRLPSAPHWPVARGFRRYWRLAGGCAGVAVRHGYARQTAEMPTRQSRPTFTASPQASTRLRIVRPTARRDEHFYR